MSFLEEQAPSPEAEQVVASTSASKNPGASGQRLGRPVLTTIDAIAQSLAIGPIFSTAFVAFLIAGAAGGTAPIAALIGAVGVLALGWVISLYARRYQGAGLFMTTCVGHIQRWGYFRRECILLAPWCLTVVGIWSSGCW